MTYTYLLDTDTIIHIINRTKAVSDQLINHQTAELFATSFSLMELTYGAYKSRQIKNNLAKVKYVSKYLKIICPNQQIIDIFGQIKAKLELKGQRLDDFDIAIAASALYTDSILVTNNIRHFKRIENLRLEQWL